MNDSIHDSEINDALTVAPKLPVASGRLVHVSSAMDIIRAIEDAEENTTILIAKGHYMMPRDCLLCTHNVTIRGETGHREDVILDSGMEFDDTNTKFSTRIGASAILKITQARGVTIADLTLANNPKYGILFFGDGRVHDLKLYNLKFHNIWARGLKGTGANGIDDQRIAEFHEMLNGHDNLEWVRPRHIEVQYCLFVADTIKKNDKDGFDGDYIAGIDVMNVYDFTVEHCSFVGIRGKHGGGRGSVFVWHHSDLVTVKSSVFYHCDRGVSFGNPSGRERASYHVRDSVITQNTFVGGTNHSIEINHANNVEVTHNTIESHVDDEHAAVVAINISERSLIKNNTITCPSGHALQCDACVTVADNDIKDLSK